MSSQAASAGWLAKWASGSSLASTSSPVAVVISIRRRFEHRTLVLTWEIHRDPFVAECRR